ncbi:MAG: hypothetical protein S4CHLAM7_13810 [Chlamydiae bacterium]|nr:hypothetical protein [Chlamydiota bacterium]
MKKRTLFLLFVCALMPLFSLNTEENLDKVSSEETNLPEMGVISKAFGHIVAKGLIENPSYQFDLENVIVGIKEELEGKASPLSEEDYESAISQIQKKCFEEMSDQNLSQANDFLEKNALNQEVKEIIPGKLQVSILKEGQGSKISENSTPLVHYTGKYLDETIFGTSDQMEPVALDLNDAIAGFKEGLIGAKEGESRRLFIHPDLGYGTTGFLLPNALMIFDIEILAANSKQAKEPS